MPKIRRSSRHNLSLPVKPFQLAILRRPPKLTYNVEMVDHHFFSGYLGSVSLLRNIFHGAHDFFCKVKLTLLDSPKN